MDLTQLTALARQVLEAEAAKRGMRHVERRSRRDLARYIVTHDYQARSTEGARNLLGALVQTAVSTLPGPLAALARLPLSTPASPGRAAANVRPPAASRAPRESGGRAHTPPSAATIAPAPESKADGAHETGAPSTRSFVEEPIRTHSMARLLAVQGHRERALSIYEELLAKNSADAALGREAAALRDGHPLTFAPGELPAPHARDKAAVALPSSHDRIECEPRGDGALCVRWNVSDAGMARARVLLGGRGELAVRVVDIRPDPARVVRSEITEHGPVPSEGEWTTQLGKGGARSFATVGLREAERFVSIAHTRAQ